MTSHSTIPTAVSALALSRASFELTGSDAARIAAAIDAELAISTRTSYASAWRQWESWCRGRDISALPAAGEAPAAYLAERAESGICFGTLDGACSAIAHRHHQEGQPDPTGSVRDSGVLEDLDPGIDTSRQFRLGHDVLIPA